MCHYRSNTEKRNCVEIPPLGVRGLTTCGNGPSYFVCLTPSYTNLLSYLRDGSETNTATVRMNYCVPSENLNFNQIESWTYQVTGSIVSTQNISNGLTVKYQAGSFIELNNGFVSGTDFIAEINPCVISRTTIAAKTDDTVEFDVTEEFNGQLLASNDVELKIYPTVLASGQGCKIVASQSIDNLQVIVLDLNGKSVSFNRIETLHRKTPLEIPLPPLSKGIYLVKTQNASVSFTQKIIIQ